jgi:hypothetical protein
MISQTWTAWRATPVVAAVLFAVGVVALLAPFVSGRRFRGDRLAMLAGALGLLLVLFRIVDLPLPDIELEGGDQADSSRGGSRRAPAAARAQAAGSARARATRSPRIAPWAPPSTR